MTSQANEIVSVTRTLDRGLSLLQLVSKGGDLTLAQISRAAGMSPSTALRLLETLRDRNFIEKNPSSGTYQIAIGALEVGSGYLRQNGLSEFLRSVLSRLTDEVGQTASYSILDRTDIVYVERIEAANTLSARGRIGERLPSYATAAGKVMLAGTWESRREEVLGQRDLLSLTPHTLTDRRLLAEELEAVRLRGWAVDNQESVIGLRCIAAAVRDGSDRIKGAISVSMIAAHGQDRRDEEIAAQIVLAAKRLSIMLGWRAPANLHTASIEIVENFYPD